MTAPKLRERDIETACTQLLELDGWRPLKTNPCSNRARGTGFGEKGMADYLYIRYIWGNRIRHDSSVEVSEVRALSQVLWIEWKRPRGKVAPHQHVWHVAERLRGALTLIAGEDFEPTVDGFLAWYRTSGLMRREGGI